MAMTTLVARIVSEWPARQADAPYSPTGHDLACLSEELGRKLTRADVDALVAAVRKELGQ